MFQHPDQSVIQLSKKDSKFRGYYLIARHYKWALNQVFHVLNYSVAVIVEGKLVVTYSFVANKNHPLAVKSLNNKLFKMHVINPNALMLFGKVQVMEQSTCIPSLI